MEDSDTYSMKEYSDTEEENIHSDVSSTESESNSDTQYYCFNVNDDAYQVKDNNLGEYINDWMQQSNQLIINRKKQAMHAFHRKGPLGLFSLFISPSFLNRIYDWTNVKLVNEGKEPMSLTEFNAYLGLELAMSLTNNNSIHEYWSDKPFLSVKGFQDVMSRRRFQIIRGSLQFRPQFVDSHSVKHNDPLWHSRTIFNELLTNCMSTAVASGVVTLDEASVRTKAKCRAKTYIPSKPDKYAIRFYTINC